MAAERVELNGVGYRVPDAPVVVVCVDGDDPEYFAAARAAGCYVLPGTGILKLPDELSDEEATPINCGVATVIAITEATRIQMGDVVAVQGLGLLGLYACAIAKARGARRVVGLDSVADRRAAAGKFGADAVIDVAGRGSRDMRW